MAPDPPPEIPRSHDAPDATRRIERSSFPHPDRIGPYRILHVLGEGGMGTVYEAEQTETIHRRVALKLIKLGMDTREVVARFEAERQALGVMDHPAIAKVLDGGATDDGRPYFVMELVHGVSLTAYCDRNALSMKQRLELFVELCNAVQHAHHKGVIHRDLKPTNVLVVEQDGKSVPKVIDFGVAKAVGSRVGEHGFVTELGQAIGTPAYMSPEQADASAMDVDTRSDVYSLGVILYELLVGALPVDWQTIGAQTYLAQLARHETQPPTPSARLTGLGAKQADIARQRQTNVSSLRKELKGDLDWVVMKALEPDRARRYETVSALAADLQRYLAGQPVLAHAPSVGYALGKVVRRHRVAVAAASAVALALVLGLAGTGIGMTKARREARTATQALDFLVGMFEEADPMSLPGERHEPQPGERPRGETLTAKEILERGGKRLETELKDEPLPRARLLDALGRVNLSLGLPGLAEPQFLEALDLRRRELGLEHADVATSLHHLGSLKRERGDYVSARAAYEEGLRIARKALGPEHPALASDLADLGAVLSVMGDLRGARSRLEEAVALQRAAPDSGRLDAAMTLDVLAGVLGRQGDHAGARRCAEQALEITRKAVGRDDAHLVVALSTLGTALGVQGDYAGARRLYEEALPIQRAAFGPDHWRFAWSLNCLASSLRAQGDLAGARQLFEQALEINRKALGPDHHRVAGTLLNLAAVLNHQGDRAGARRLYEQALAIHRKAFGPESPDVAINLGNLAELLRDDGDRAEAMALFEEALEIQRKVFGPEHPEVARSLSQLAAIRRDDGDRAGAMALFEQALEIQRKVFGPEHPEVARSLLQLAAIRRREGDLIGARPLYEQSLAIYRRTLPAHDPSLAYPLKELGILSCDLGELERAEALLREAFDICETASEFGPGHSLTARVRDALAETLRGMGRAGEADAHFTNSPRRAERPAKIP